MYLVSGGSCVCVWREECGVCGEWLWLCVCVGGCRSVVCVVSGGGYVCGCGGRSVVCVVTGEGYVCVWREEGGVWLRLCVCVDGGVWCVW